MRPMSANTWRLPLACAAAWALACWAPALAQPSPAGPELRVNSYTTDDQREPAVAADADGSFVVVWSSTPDFSNEPAQDGSGSGVFAQRFDRSGQPTGPEFQVNETTHGDQDSPAIALNADGFIVVWRSQPELRGPSRIFARRYDRLGVPQGGEFQVTADSPLLDEQPDVALDAAGNATIVWVTGISESGYITDPHVFLRRYDFAGIPAGPPIPVETSGDFGWEPAVAADAAGRAIVVWAVSFSEETQQIRGRRYDPAGRPEGGPFRVSVQPESFNPDVSCSPGGACVVVWESLLVQHFVYARRFPAAGAAPPELLVRNPFDYAGKAVRPRVSCDAAGGFVVVWNSEFSGSARRYDPAGSRQGSVSSFQGLGIDVASAANGDFVTVYIRIEKTTLDVFARRFLLPPAGADPCLFLPGGRLSCDVFRDGGEAEIAMTYEDARPGDVPLLGNVDGDTRDDLCLYHAGRFLCDTSHDGRSAVEIGFGGAAGDRPLLGDLNGDGRADPCLRRGRRFLCDTAHNGGTAEVQVVFGRASDVPLLGDVNGDGADDPCVFRDGELLCDTVHDGGAAEVVLAFGQKGDAPFLADFDHDGDDDPCVYRGGLFLCDTAHDGGAPEVMVAFGASGAIPLLGNVNGI